MAWDDTKASDGTLTAAEWNAHVTDQKTRVPASGGTFSGHINVPSGATGTQVPQATEVMPKTGGTFSGHITVPAGATGSQVPRASEVITVAGGTLTGALAVPAGAAGSQVPRVSEVLKKTEITSGTTSILPETSSIVVNHNIGSTPTFIGVTPATGFVEWRVSAVTSTTFTIEISAPQPSGVTFMWSARV